MEGGRDGGMVFSHREASPVYPVFLQTSPRGQRADYSLDSRMVSGTVIRQSLSGSQPTAVFAGQALLTVGAPQVVTG